MNKKWFILYLDQEEIFDALTDEQAGRLIKASFDYNSGKKVSLEKELELLFLTFRATFNRNDQITKLKQEKTRMAANIRWKNERSESIQTHADASESTKRNASYAREKEIYREKENKVKTEQPSYKEIKVPGTTTLTWEEKEARIV